jgi:hypothetical protein
MFEEMVFIAGEMGDAPTALLLMAGLVRDDYPWLAELLSESYREIRDVGPNEAERVVARLRRSVKHLSRGNMMREMAGSSKDAMFMLDELPMFLDMTVHRMMELSGQARVSDEKSNE